MRIPSYLQWLIILIPCAAILWFVFAPLLGIGVLPDPAQAALASGSIGAGGLFQEPLPAPRVFHHTLGEWDYILTAKYRYFILAKVVTRQDYAGQGADQITPLDLGVACGDVISPDNFPYFSFSTGFRKLNINYRPPPGSIPMPVWYIQRFISNNHMVFLNESVYEKSQNIKPGDCVVIRGYLVDITGTTPSGGSYARSTSIIRNDAYITGCETVLAESVDITGC